MTYRLVNREQQIEDLIMWIAESKRESDKFLMKADLKYLINLEDENVFSNLDTNEFIAKSDNPKRFKEIENNEVEKD